MSNNNRDLIQRARKTLRDLDEVLRQIDEVLQSQQDEIDYTLITRVPREATYDPRRPYLAGRQPRRDGDSYGSVAPSLAGDAHGEEGNATEKR